MPRNGEFPLSNFVLVASGWNGDGYWEHRLPAGTLQRWNNLVADVLANEGVNLEITPGWNAYRPLGPQEQARKAACARGRCQDAATPGTSSHGGVFQGRDAMAIDVGNYARIGKAKFYEYARKHGFTVNVFDWEPWHIIDFNPWVVPAPPAPQNTEENPDMPVFIEPNIINWPNGYTNVYDRNVYLACQWVANRQITEQWAVDIYVSESWKAARELDRILKEDDQPVKVDPVSQDALAKRVAQVIRDNK